MVTTDIATSGVNNYIKESEATMEDYGEDMDNIDFGMLGMSKDVVDDDEEERDDLIKLNCLYEDGGQLKVEAGGILTYTGALGAPSVIIKAHSPSSANIRQGYHSKPPTLSQEKGRTATL